MISRRTLLKSGAGAGAAHARRARHRAGAEEDQLPHLEHHRPGGADPRLDRALLKDRPGVEVEWLDKKGPDFPAFYQTQLVAGTPPDVINTQGALGLEYAAQGALLDLTPLSQKRAPPCKSRFNADYLANWVYEGKNYMLPFYITKTLLFYNKPMFQKAGPVRPAAELRRDPRAAQKMTSGESLGLPDAQLRLALLAAVHDERRRSALAGPARSRPSTRRRRSRSLDRLAKATADAARSTRSPGPAAGSSPTAPSPPATSACCTRTRRPTSSSRGRAAG